MPICPKCSTSLPDGMRFCLECGNALVVAVDSEIGEPLAIPAIDPFSVGWVPLGPTPPASEPAPVETAPAPGEPPFARPRPSPLSTVALRISPSPVIAPRGDMRVEPPRPSLGSEIGEVDEEALKKAFEKPVHPGIVVCRFCKDPLDLAGDFCEQCGAPVDEAMPPGTVRPGRASDSSVASPPGSASPSPSPINPHLGPGETPAAPASPKPFSPATASRPMPAPSYPPARPPAAPEPPSGLLDRLKDAFTRDKFKKS